MLSPSRLAAALLALAALAGCNSADVAPPAPSAAPWSWAFALAAPNTATGARVAVGPGDEVAVAGPFPGVTFDGTPLAETSGSVLLATLSASGAPLYTFAPGDDGSSQANGVGFDLAGQVVLAGTFSNPLTLAGQPVDPISQDTFVTAFDKTGAGVWAQHLSADLGGPTGVGTSGPTAGLAVDAQGDLVLAGTFSGTFGLGGAPLDTASSMDTAVFVGKLDPAGNEVWSRAIGAGGQTATALAVGAAGQIFVAGVNSGTLTLGGVALHDDDNGQPFVSALGPGGDPRWAIQLAGDAAITALVADAAGDVIMLGSFATTLSIGSTSVASNGAMMTFVASLSSTGAVKWIRAFDDVEVVVEALTLGAQGDVIMAGSYAGTPDLGGGPLPSGQDALFLLELDAAGHHVKSRSLGAAATGAVESLARTADGDLVLLGTFFGELDLGSGVLVAGGATAYFVARIPG